MRKKDSIRAKRRNKKHPRQQESERLFLRPRLGAQGRRLVGGGFPPPEGEVPSRGDVSNQLPGLSKTRRGKRTIQRLDRKKPTVEVKREGKIFV